MNSRGRLLLKHAVKYIAQIRNKSHLYERMNLKAVNLINLMCAPVALVAAKGGALDASSFPRFPRPRK